MGFTTQTFLFAFFPVCMISYIIIAVFSRKGIFSAFLQKIRADDLLLIGFSLCFYMWACFDDLIRLLLYILAVFGMGVWLQKTKERNTALCISHNGAISAEKSIPLARIVLFISAALPVFVLFVFKYTSLLAQFWNFLFKGNLQGNGVAAMLGISFITFSAVSYLADIYMGKATAGNLIDCALYLSFFPKIVSGPIALWRDFKPQIKQKRFSLNFSAEGITLIATGFAKKLILADQFGAQINSIGTSNIDTATVWLSAVLYMLQLYFDFSGYSDIAIGISKLFGYEIDKNFNFPYLSTSIGEFWRRWHISLGRWFREYIYFPLGGSRAGLKRTLINLGVVFALTGFWHGAGWNYMIWGGINGFCVIVERLLSGNKIYEKAPKVIKWITTMFITLCCWQVFRFENFRTAARWLLTMFGFMHYDNIAHTCQYFVDGKIITLMLIGIVGSTVFGLPKIKALYSRFSATKVGYAVQQIVVLALFALSIMFMVNSSYSPFLYFQY